MIPVTHAKFIWRPQFLRTVSDPCTVITHTGKRSIKVDFCYPRGATQRKVFPMSKDASVRLYSLINELCTVWFGCTDWMDEVTPPVLHYDVDVCDGWHWELILLNEVQKLGILTGTVEMPLRGAEIREIIGGVVGEENCYVF